MSAPILGPRGPGRFQPALARRALHLVALLTCGLVVSMPVRAQTVVLAGTYTAATITGDVSIAANTNATFTSGSNFTGANATFGNNAGLYWQQIGTLAGKSITLGSGAYIYVNGTGSTLTLGPTTTVTGDTNIYSGSTGSALTNQGTINHTSGSSSIYAPTFVNSGTITSTAGTLYVGYPNTYNSSNTGSIIADGSGTTVYIRGNFANSGTLTAQNSGVLLFDGTNTSANLGNVTIASGGHARLNGTITNTSLGVPTGGPFELYGGTISGGTIAAGALTYTGAGGYLDGTTLNDNLTLAANAFVRFTGGATFTGSTATLGNNGAWYWEQAATLAGKSLTFAPGAYVYVNGTNNTLTLGPTTTATGDTNIYANGSAGSAITNQGTINHTTGSSSIYAPTFTNSGTITSTAGTLYLGYPNTYNSSNSGSIVADGSSTTVYIRGNFSNSGTLTAQNSGVLYFDGTNTSGNLGNVTIASGGHARLNGTVTNAALSAPTGGAFELYGGTIKGGTIAPGAVTFTGSGGYLDGATLNDNLSLAANAFVRFTGGATFTGSTATLGNNAAWYWEQAATLAGKSLTFASSAYLYVNGTNNTLTLGPTTTVTGDTSIYSNGSIGSMITNQGTINHTTGSSSIYAPTFTNSGTITSTAGTLYLGYPNTYNSSNSGSIVADGSSTTVYIRGNFSNSGTLTAQNSGVLYFDGNNTSGNLGSVTIASGGHARLNGTVANTVLSVPTGGTFELYGGTITGGTIPAGALTFTGAGGYLDGATLNDNLSLATNAFVRFTGGASFTGSTATLGNNAAWYWEQIGTLAGKSITFGSGAYLYVNGTNNTLTLGPTTTVTGDTNIYSNGSTGSALTNQGTINHTAGTSSIYAPTFTNSGNITSTAGTLYLGYPNTYNSTNSGTVVADGSNTTVYIRGNFTNTGTMTAQNAGVLFFDGTNSSGNLGNVTIVSGGHARLNGTLANASLTAPTGGTFELYGGTISGGTIAAGALTFTSSGGYLDATSLTGDLTLASNASVRLQNGATFSGANVSLAANAGLYWQQNATLNGKNVSIGSGGYIYVAGTNSALTLGPSTTVTGSASIYSDGSNGTTFVNQGTINHTGGTASMWARSLTNSGTITATAGTLYFGTSSTNYATTNAGSLTVDGASTYLVVDGAVANTGTIRAQNAGTIYFQGTNTSANLGSVQIATGAHGYLNGTITNNAATLAAPAAGVFELLGGTITGGTIAPGALTFTPSGGYLDGTTFTGNLDLPSNTYVRLLNNATFTGATGSFGSNSGVYWQQSGTLSGKALTLGSNAFLYVSGANHTLTLAPTSSVTGDASIYSDNSAGSAITNQGTILHNNGSGSLYAMSFTNSGSITAASGSLYLGTGATGATLANDSGATLRVTGGASMVLQLPGTTQLSNQGTIDVQNGTLYTSGHLTNAAGGVISGAGTITGNVTLAGGTIAPGNSGIGTLTFQNGSLNVTGPSTFAVDIGGNSADRLVFQNPPSAIDLGAGLLSLSVTLASPPVDNTSYGLLQISSGGSGITGTFAGLPVSGSWVTANYNGTPYIFAVNYQPNLVSLYFSPVPEPSTYVLLGTGLLALLGLRRRKR